MRITKKSKNFFGVFLTLLAIILSGCSSAISVVPSTAPLSQDKGYTVITSNVTGRSWAWSILFLGFGSDTPTYDALQSALKENNADALIDVAVTYRVFNLLYLLGFYETEISGKAIKFYDK